MVRMSELQIHGARLRAVRLIGGVRLVELARAVDCSYSHLWRAEKQNRPISAVLAYRVARALTNITGREVTIDQFTSPIEHKAAA